MHDGSSDRWWRNICSIQYQKRNQIRMRSCTTAVLFAMMLLVAFRDCEVGVPVRFRNLRRLQARTKTFAAMLRDLLYADDCALLAHSEADAQHLFDRLYMAASRFGLTVSLKKMEVMLQPHNRSSFTSPSITAGDVKLSVVDKFCYLGCILT